MAVQERVMVDWLTVNQVAEMFGRTGQMVRLWLWRHRLPYIRIPGDFHDVIRFDRKRVLAWAKKNNVERLKPGRKGQTDGVLNHAKKHPGRRKGSKSKPKIKQRLSLT